MSMYGTTLLTVPLFAGDMGIEHATTSTQADSTCSS